MAGEHLIGDDPMGRSLHPANGGIAQSSLGGWGHTDITRVRNRLAVCKLPNGHYGRARSLARLGRAPSGTTPWRAFSRLSSLVFSRTASQLRIRCCVSGVQKTPSRRRARVIAV